MYSASTRTEQHCNSIWPAVRFHFRVSEKSMEEKYYSHTHTVTTKHECAAGRGRGVSRGGGMKVKILTTRIAKWVIRYTSEWLCFFGFLSRQKLVLHNGASSFSYDLNECIEQIT